MTNRDINKSPLTLDNTIPNPPAYNIFNQLRSMATHSLAGLKYIHFPVLYNLLDARVCSAVDPGTTPTVSEKREKGGDDNFGAISINPMMMMMMTSQKHMELW